MPGWKIKQSNTYKNRPNDDQQDIMPILRALVVVIASFFLSNVGFVPPWSPVFLLEEGCHGKRVDFVAGNQASRTYVAGRLEMALPLRERISWHMLSTGGSQFFSIEKYSC